MDNKNKTILAGGLLLMGGIIGALIFVVGHFQKVPSPSSSVSGTVINYTPAYTTSTDSRESATCVVHYKVGDKEYNIVDTCGLDIFGSGDRLGDKVEVVYSTENPAKGSVNRSGFVNCVGALSLPLLLFGYLLLRKSRRMNVETDEDSDALI